MTLKSFILTTTFMLQTEVLIVGAGPTGLTLALWLTKQGIKVRIIDKSNGPGETSRAMAIQARTLELYRQLDMTDAIIKAGYRIPVMNMWAGGKRQAQIKMLDVGGAISPYPFILIYPQDRHEQFLIERLQTLGVEVERQTEFLSFEEKTDQIIARLKDKNGQEAICQAQYLAACDGARSPIRHQIGSGFKGDTYKGLFYVADVVATGVEPSGEAQIAFEKSDFMVMLPYTDTGNYRLVGIVHEERGENPERLTFEEVGHQAIQALNVTIDKVNWFSTYKVHHRVTDYFRRSRTFLLGDAAHVHSPAGGQGMNTGIQDAINLAWKLAAVVKGQASDPLLDSYEIERKQFAQKLVETTDRVFTFATTEGSIADFLRNYIAPLFVGLANRLGNVREYMFRIVSQTMLSYHESPLSSGKADAVQGGDRLPWVPVQKVDNYDPLSIIGWQVHVYGEPGIELKAWGEQNRVPVYSFTWHAEYGKAGLVKDALYLLRPDTYVALVDPEGSVVKLNDYFNKNGIHLNP